jgi:hypothetical protein
MPIPAVLAPLLAQGLGLISNAVMAKGKEWVESKTGVNLDQPLSSEDTLKLRQFEMDHQEELMKIRVEEKRLGIEELQAYIGDTKSARDMNTRINESANASWLSKNVVAILALIVITTGFALLAVTKEADVRTAVVGLMTLVLGFFFGSSSSSRSKDDTMKTMAEMIK